ncbi:unnamed protein product [Aureobasidium vineae]|uniref:RPAP1-like protein n=1 Tax=Aureobasidium vineae TaxID=2773715 RepID=A0A9N8J7W4_9PEZI|nr:unnamed protein product [Aureobasidium vineae]
MTLRGQQFSIDDFDAQNSPEVDSAPKVFNPFNFVADVQERKPTAAPAPPQPPAFKNSTGGFPAHRKRNVQSRFKKSRQQDVEPIAPTPQPQGNDLEDDDDDFMTTERRRIDEENRQRIAEMSPEEIEEERRELLSSLDPSLIQRLLGRATIEEGGSNEDFPGLQEKVEETKQEAKPQPDVTKPRKTVKFAEVEDEPVGAEAGFGTRNGNDTSSNNHKHDHSGHEAAAEVALPTDSTIHFPRPPQPPSLDPSDPNFLEDLHEKYFPDLPADPEKLEWMTSTPKNAYSASQTSLDPKDIRFAFTGALIPPSLAAEIPVTMGLHHHGDAPDAAGYTIPELAMLARSSVPAQRCVAFQTLGRVLYRLGKGEFGDPGEEGQGTVDAKDTLGELARGLWFEVKKESVLEICLAESEGRGAAGGRHIGAKSYATEAVWLWQQGGGRRWKAE